MKAPLVISALSALAHEHRLAIYRLLVERGPEGLPAGVIVSSTKIAAGQSVVDLAFEADPTAKIQVSHLSIKGVAKELTVPVKLTYLPGKLKARTGRDGDLLVLRSTFTIKRGEFGINEGQMEDKVSNDIEISLSVAGAAPKG